MSRNRARADVELEDLDGEDRHLLGVTKKQQKIESNSHWKSDIHDYLPGFEGEKELSESEGDMSLRQVGSEDQILLRRALMELAKIYAQEDRERHQKAPQQTNN